MLGEFFEKIGEDSAREGLRDTPERFSRALMEMTAGKREPAGEYKTFAVEYDDLIIVRDIPFSSLCEHHLMPITGVAHVGYIPSGRVIGLSKLARIVQRYAKRLQLQERMTRQVAVEVNERIGPIGVGVVIEARHSCMCDRGVGAMGSITITSCMLGALRDQWEIRREFLALLGRGGAR